MKLKEIKMLASVLIEYNVKTLNKCFDYLIPEELSNFIKIGNKVLVPFGNSVVEGFVLEIKKETNDKFNYKSIIEIKEKDFYLKKDLLSLGVFMSKKTMSNLISCYQIMLPSALKANSKNISVRKYEKYIYLNKKIDIEKYILDNKRNTKEIKILIDLKDGKKLKKYYTSPSLNSLLKKNIVLLETKEVNRDVDYIKENDKNILLNEEQVFAYNTILNEKKNNVFLLHGVTGSGKTEVYIKLIEHYLAQDKTAILLVPEISLTPQIVARFKSVFKEKVAVLHSKLSPGEKYDEYRKIMKNEVKVVIGARSALFAPLENIGIIIIDECQSSTYKQENTPKYNGIEVAIERTKLHNAKCVLGSATPLLEQYARALKGVYKLVSLNNRISGHMPNIELIDMSESIKKRNFVISEKLDNEIKKTLLKKEQIILLLNRRGYSTFISCSNCGYVYKCPNCDISMVYHKSTNNLICHYCGYQHKMNTICPECQEESIKDLGLGTEKLEEYIKKKYNVATLRMDADTTANKGSYEKYIEDFKNNKYDILIGTQMVSKGLNFPNVSLIGILNIDASLAIPDFRSGERTFELLTQTAGRSGRYEREGKVLIQTYNPSNYVFKYVINNDFISFYDYEMKMRRKLNYPPYYNIASVKVTSKDYEEAKETVKKIKKYFENELPKEKFIILGPSTARIFKLKNYYNFNIMIKYKYEENLFEVFNKLNNNFISNKIRVDIDINPINIL